MVYLRRLFDRELLKVGGNVFKFSKLFTVLMCLQNPDLSWKILC